MPVKVHSLFWIFLCNEPTTGSTYFPEAEDIFTGSTMIAVGLSQQKQAKLFKRLEWLICGGTVEQEKPERQDNKITAETAI